ncbi:transcriptional regulator, TetR family [Bifidobacterium bohemicum]|uniref:Transcriptional regulator, TetR family n=1 Tax=Bifidobacterium bohemicum DSM 22767 TaxID=1437606 RepID=A0A086ZHL4_9BIFI|nr:TetR/AcrR family transcriptional regulator [Bifidobacterium bohemicum]KFI46014.1 transcriptional regulator, TetR family [Bifidobacterium bohemicum DSM 22767]SCC04745.1 transcriptional regulator, TetR family [Bifidobacterium bohemicum]
MSRPRHDSSQPSATIRMEEAFWELLEEKRYSKITVTDIVERADVNRNSFYYHYNKLNALAQSAVRHCVEDIVKTLPEIGQDYSETWRNIVVQTLGVPSNMKNLRRIRLLVGEHSCARLLECINETMYDCLGKWLNLGDEIGTVSGLTLEFTVGGLLCLISAWPALKHHCNINELNNLDSALIARSVYLTLTNERAPSLQIQLLRMALKETNDSMIDAIHKTETEDPEFKQEMDSLLVGMRHAEQRNDNPQAPHTSE